MVKLFVCGKPNKKKVSLIFIESPEILRDTVPEFLAIIVGQGEELQNLKPMVSGYGLNGHVKFYGIITKTELFTIIKII